MIFHIYNAIRVFKIHFIYDILPMLVAANVKRCSFQLWIKSFVLIFCNLIGRSHYLQVIEYIPRSFSFLFVFFWKAWTLLGGAKIVLMFCLYRIDATPSVVPLFMTEFEQITFGAAINKRILLLIFVKILLRWSSVRLILINSVQLLINLLLT